MKRSQLEHLIRAAGTIAQDDELIIVGSQAILGQFPDASNVLLVSIEADIFPKKHPELSDLIDGSIGEGSPFHATFGYYAHGVSEQTSVLPAQWKERLVPIRNENTLGITGWCLEVHDLAISKYVAARDKDLRFTEELAKSKLTNRETLLRRLNETTVSDQLRVIIEGRIERDFTNAI